MASSSGDEVHGLTPSQLASFHENGYLLIPNYLSPAEVASLLTTTHSLLDSFDLSTHPLTRFTTGDDPETEGTDSKHVGDDYFLTSGDKIRFFFEPDAFDKDTNKLKASKSNSINKIGHALHELSPPFKSATLSPQAASIGRSLGFISPRVLQSMVICKQPRIGARVSQHRDSEFLYTSPPSAVGVWIALQDASAQNGTLGFWKGSHRTRISRRFVRCKVDGDGTEFVNWEGPGLPKGLEEDETRNNRVYSTDDGDFELVDVPAGSAVLIHGNVLHASEKNTGDKSRYAYTFHIIECADGWVYDERNWLQPTEQGFTRLYTE